MYIEVSGSYNVKIPQDSPNYAMEYIILSCDTSLAPVTINLLEIIEYHGFQNQKFMIVDRNGNAVANPITINPDGIDTINGAPNFVINTAFGSVLLNIADKTMWQALDPAAGGAPGTALHYVTYAQLTALIAGNGLIQGDFYLLTDFATRYTVPNTAVVNTGAIEPLLFQAATVSKINVNPISTIHPNDIITYEVIDSTTAGGNKGRISFRKDTSKNNSTYYDWRVVLFRRWETAPASGIFTVITNNGGAFIDFHTFDNVGLNPFQVPNTNTSLGPITNYGITNYGSPTSKLNNFVFSSCNSISNIFGDDCFNNTITGGDCISNKAGDNFSNNTIASDFQYNIIGNGYSSNDIGILFMRNRIPNDFFSNTTLGVFSKNTITANVVGCTFGAIFTENSISLPVTVITFPAGLSDRILESGNSTFSVSIDNLASAIIALTNYQSLCGIIDFTHSAGALIITNITGTTGLFPITIRPIAGKITTFNSASAPIAAATEIVLSAVSFVATGSNFDYLKIENRSGILFQTEAINYFV
jgi:hypothetical protein